MKLLLKSDGTYEGVWIEDENGNRIENVRDIEMKFPFPGCPEVTVTFIVPPDGKRKVEVTTMDQAARGEKEFVDAEEHEHQG